MKKLFAVSLLAGSVSLMAHSSPVPHDGSMKGVDQAQPIDQAVGMRVLKGYTPHVFADNVGRVRHLAAHKSGWLFASVVKSRRGTATHGLLALKDTNGDGKADEKRLYAEGQFGTGLAIDGNDLYFGTDQKILKFTLDDQGMITGDAVTLVDGFTINNQHDAKSLTVDGKGGLYVNFGVPSNACMEKMRTKGSPGQRPCTILDNYGGVWKFDAAKSGQTQEDGIRYSTGHRNAVALEWNRQADDLYLVNHGRDQLFSFFPDLYTQEASAELPAEEFHRVKKGDNLGWPYSYYDQRVGARMVMPEYGGDGKTKAKEGKKPLIGFPGHWAPNDLLFPSDASGLPMGALIAFHGSWNRGRAQRGYRVVFVPLDKKGNVSGQWITFADGFANPVADGEAVNQVASPRQAKHRPMGLAEGPKGSLYIASLMSGGRIWQIKHD